MASRLTELFAFKPGEPFYATLARHCYRVISTVTGARPCRLVLIDAAEYYLLYEFGFGPATASHDLFSGAN
jgi:hypothetical protein